jgi:heavy metal sensor kinase
MRLAWSYAATVAFVLLAFSAGIFAFVSHVLNEELNTRLADDFGLAAETLQVRDEGVDLAPRRDSREHDEQQPWVEIWDAQPSIRFRTPRAGSAMLDDLTSIPAADRHRTASVTAVTGERLRMMVGNVRRDGGRYVIRVARSEEPLRHELGELLFGMALALPLAIGLSSLVGARMARRALHPVELMADHARRITAERLHDRLPVENPNDELGRLATVFNDTLARLDSSFHQLRRFTADASHELRTPLTALRSVGEVGLAERHDADGYRDIIGSMLEDADRLTRLVESLLTLSRADAGVAALRPEGIDLSQLARNVVNDLCVLAEEKQQLIRIEATNPAFTLADRITVTQALVNLLDNAIKYSPKGAVIVVEVSANGEAHIDVLDSGPGIPAEHQQRIFDRFYRIDEARARGNGGVGLGLSIAQWAVHANHGQLSLHRTDSSGSTFRIKLPLYRGPRV